MGGQSAENILHAMVSKVRHLLLLFEFAIISMIVVRDGGNYLAVGDILGNVIILKPTPKEFFFKFYDRVLEGSSRFHHILSINLSPKSTLMVVSRCDGNIFVFKEFVEVVKISSVLDNLELISRAKKMPKKLSKSPPRSPQHSGKLASVKGGKTAILNENENENETPEDDSDGSVDVSKTTQVMRINMFQLHIKMMVRPSSAVPIQCCSISDAGM